MRVYEVTCKSSGKLSTVFYFLLQDRWKTGAVGCTTREHCSAWINILSKKHFSFSSVIARALAKLAVCHCLILTLFWLEESTAPPT
jgi:hypothetical protein